MGPGEAWWAAGVFCARPMPLREFHALLRADDREDRP
jgi:hypothetical protein